MPKNSENIINALAEAGHYVTSTELAKMIGVSPKTIYRKIRDLNSRYSEPIVNSERGKGYCLDYNRYLRLSGQHQGKSNGIIYSPLERRNEVVTKLLFNAPRVMDIHQVYEKYYVSDDLVKQDLVAINKILKKYQLILSHRGKYVAVVGDEKNIRKAINASLIQSNAMEKESISDLASEFTDLTDYDNQFLIAQLDWIQKSFDTTIPYPYNINIFSHLFVLIKRFRDGKVIETSSHVKLATCYQRLIEDNPQIFKVSNDVIRNTSDYIHCKIPEIESYYLMEYLISMRYNHNLVFDKGTSAEAIRLANYYISKFDLNSDSQNVKSLENDLVSHLRPMINRLRNGIVIANKLLNDIKTEYGQLFNQLRSLSNQATQSGYLDWQISDDEIGFLTLYFAKYFEEVSLKKRVLIMCTSGVGTSKLLYARIHHSFPNLDLVGVTSKVDYEEHPEKYRGIDLIVSTILVITHDSTRVILSSAMFNSQDRRRLSEALEENEIEF